MLGAAKSIHVALNGLEAETYFCHSPSNCPCLLRSEIKGEVLLAFVVFAQVLACLLVHHGQHSCDRFADGGAAKQ